MNATKISLTLFLALAGLFTFSVAAQGRPAQIEPCSIRFELHYRTVDFINTNIELASGSGDLEVLCSTVKQGVKAAETLVKSYGGNMKCLGRLDSFTEAELMESATAQTIGESIYDRYSKPCALSKSSK